MNDDELDALAAQQSLRRAAIRHLANVYGIEDRGPEATQFRTSAEEDLAEYLYDEVRLGQWCVVTTAGEYTYLHVVETYNDASSRAEQHIDNDLYAESPHELVDLDTGDVHTPRFEVSWHKLSRGYRDDIWGNRGEEG